jgi:hypothetical protein
MPFLCVLIREDNSGRLALPAEAVGTGERQQAMVFAAGLIAEDLHLRLNGLGAGQRPYMVGCLGRTDLRHLRTLCQHDARLIADVWADASRVVADQWGAVEVIAAQLVARGRLGAVSVKATVAWAPQRAVDLEPGEQLYWPGDYVAATAVAA